ncbi:MAG: hypothetical protein ACLUOI_05760 [Eisenbergiella sp.]
MEWRQKSNTMFRFVGKLWLSAGKIAEKWKPDVIITSSTYPFIPVRTEDRQKGRS